MVSRGRQLLLAVEEAKKDMDMIRFRLHGAGCGKRKALRKQAESLRGEITDRLLDLLDHQRRENSA